MYCVYDCLAVEDQANVLVLRKLNTEVSPLEVSDILNEAGLDLPLRLVEEAQPHRHPLLLRQREGFSYSSRLKRKIYIQGP